MVFPFWAVRGIAPNGWVALADYKTLNLNKDFRRLYGRGRSYIHPALVTYVLKNRAGCCRIGITASKKIGNAVKRNRARRVITAAWRQNLPNVDNRYDLVFVARTRATQIKSTEMERVMRSHLQAAGLWAVPEKPRAGERNRHHEMAD